MSDLEDPIDAAGGDDDLFGDDSNDAGSPLEERERMLSDVELDDDADDKLPENDEGAYDNRMRGGDYSDDDDLPRSQQQPQTTKQRLIMDKTLYRHRLPKCKDQTLGLLRVPNFLRFIPEEYKPDSFEPTEADVANARDNYPHETIRWMQDSEGGKLLSNAALYRWSDGSVTLGVGGEHYDLQQKGLAPPTDKPYNETNDANMYAATAEVASNLLVVFGHLTEQLTVLPTGSEKDDALSQLAARMAKAVQGRQKEMVVKVTGSDNPELVRKQVEATDRELQRAQRRRENAEMRAATGAGRPSRSTGLSVGGLEGGGRAAGRKRGAPGAARQKRRKPEYDSDDDLPQGTRRQDEYERDDGFIVSSGDEDEEAGEEEEEEEEEEGDFLDDEDEAPRSKRQKTSTPEVAGGGGDKGGRDAGRSRRRRVVDDDDEDE